MHSTQIHCRFYHQPLVIEVQFFKGVKYVQSINQMHFLWLLNIKYFSIVSLKHVLFYFTSSNQNKLIWLVACTYFTYLKNCSSISNSWEWKCNQGQKKYQIFKCVVNHNIVLVDQDIKLKLLFEKNRIIETGCYIWKIYGSNAFPICFDGTKNVNCTK